MSSKVASCLPKLPDVPWERERWNKGLVRTTDGNHAFSWGSVAPAVTLALFFFNVYLFFIYLAMLSLSCGTRVILVVAGGTQFPKLRIGILGPLHWELRVQSLNHLTTREVTLILKGADLNYYSGL